MIIKTLKELSIEYLIDLTIGLMKKNPNFLNEYEKEFGLTNIQDILDRIDLKALKRLPVKRSAVALGNHTAQKENATKRL